MIGDRYALKRQGLASYTSERLAHLESLVALLDSAADGESADDDDDGVLGSSKVEGEILCVDISTAFAVPPPSRSYSNPTHSKIQLYWYPSPD
eukprot:COSAG05_NODE_1013_length_6190_cov_4.171236_4_plen_93_part_00